MSLLSFQNHKWPVIPGGGGLSNARFITDTVGSANKLIDLSSFSLVDGDTVIVALAHSSGVDTAAAIITAGYTAVDPVFYVVDTFKLNFGVFYKRMGASPDADVTVNASANSTGAGGVTVLAVNGVDAVTFNDVTPVRATGTNGAYSNGDPITPVTSGAWIVSAGAMSTDSTPVAFTGPANMTDFNQNGSGGSTRGAYVGMSLNKTWTSGAFDPDPWTGGETGVNVAAANLTFAIRPA
jgi:hypothetical protein